jgi:hypothetical protein
MNRNFHFLVTPTEWLSSDRLFLNSTSRMPCICSSLRNCDRPYQGKTTCPPSAQLSQKSHLFKEKQSQGRSMLPQRKNEISSLPPSHNGRGSHRREEHSPAFVELHLQWSYPLALELVHHSSIVTDFAMEKTSRKSHLFQSRNGHTDGACFPMERTKFLHFPLTPTGSGPHRREEHSLALVELNGVIRLP